MVTLELFFVAVDDDVDTAEFQDRIPRGEDFDFAPIPIVTNDLRSVGTGYFAATDGACTVALVLDDGPGNAAERLCDILGERLGRPVIGLVTNLAATVSSEGWRYLQLAGGDA